MLVKIITETYVEVPSSDEADEIVEVINGGIHPDEVPEAFKESGSIEKVKAIRWVDSDPSELR